MTTRLLVACALTTAVACSVPTATELDGGGDGATDAMPSTAALSIAPDAPTGFGDVVIGAISTPVTFTVTNDGDGASGAIAIVLDDPAVGFELSEDTCAGLALPGHSSCSFDVAFRPTGAGDAATAVRLTAEPGGELARDLAGRGLVRGEIDLVEPDHDFGPLGIDGGARVHTFDVTNTGQVPIGAPVATIGGATDTYAVDSTTCDHALAPDEHCAIVVRFDPITVGSKAASITVSATPGGADAASLGGLGIAHVTVVKVGTGAGLVTSNQPGLDCGTACAADFASSPVTLTAAADLGSVFGGWSDDCGGTGSCALELSGAKRATALFRAITPTLTVTKLGAGAGTVTSIPAGIACGVACVNDFAYGTVVSLTAAAATGSTFAGWSGACTGTGTCDVTMDQVRAVTATFDPITPTLTVTTVGAGTVTSAPLGIACGATCAAAFTYGTPVGLTAAAAIGATFAGWSGACTGTGACTVTMDQARAVTATFDPITPTLTVSTSGAGTGSVRSSIGPIVCPGTCSATFAYATSVTLTASTDGGSTFAGWSGACAGTGPCTVTMDQARTVGARFDVFVPTLTINRAGTGTGTVLSSPAGIACGATCSRGFPYDSPVTLSATAANGSTWSGWSGPGAAGCAGSTGLTCTVTMDQARTIVATFDGLTPTLAVTTAGSGTGAVTSIPAGIQCGSTCNASYAFGTDVMLTAAATTGSTFAGWSGACTGTGSMCVVTVDRARAVTAMFDAVTPTLTVSRAGTGGGVVRSMPAGVDCGATCAHDFTYGTPVTLTASAGAGDVFTGWSGDCAGATATCTLIMTQARAVTAQFTAGPRTLTVIRAGAGTGTVASSPAGIACGTTCSQAFAYATAVTLTATATGGSAFLGWSGACSAATGTCTVTMDQARSVTATFGPPVTMALAFAGTGSGTVSSTPAGLDCTAACSATFPYGTTVVLGAAAAGGSTFTGWSGAPGCATGATCIVTITGAMAITATFAAGPQILRVDAAGGDGVGGVRSAPAGIDCGVDCTQGFPYGDTVVLTATPSGGATFTGWSGACTGTGPCSVTMTAARNVTAAFAAARTLTVTLAGTGTGTLTSAPAGIACSTGSCSASFAYASSVAVTAAPTSGSTFRAWSGPASTMCASLTAATCSVTMELAAALTATFDAGPQTLSVAKAGTGAGTITSAPAGIACTTGTCTHDFPYATDVTLSAAAAAGSSFVGWSGISASACADLSAPTCTVAMTAARSLTASFTANPRVLTITRTGTGAGTVTSSPAGITCPGTCAAAFTFGTSVTVTAAPTGVDTFGGWSGPSAASCSAAPACTVAMDQARDLTATFDAGPQTLTVTRAGTGTVTSTPAGISCGAACSASFGYNTSVALAANAGAGFTFTGWSGACSGTGACTVTMNQARAVTATFTAITPALTVTTAGTGGGTITAAPAGTPNFGACSGSCTATYPYNTAVALIQAAAIGSTFAGWSGACSGTGACAVTMDQMRAVTATFTAITPTLTVTRTSVGTGAAGGTVTSADAAISCGATCTHDYAYGATVTLTAAPQAGANFSGWSGACSGTGACTLTMDQARGVTAAFSLPQNLAVTVASTPPGFTTLGTVTAIGISCPGSCSSNYTYGTMVTLTAAATSLGQFTGWSGACTGTGACTVTMDQTRAVTATFAGLAQSLTVTRVGSGTVTGTSINCGTTCTASYGFATSVTLSAAAATGFTFTGWSGACAGTGGCTVTMDQARAVTATFTAITPTLTVTAAGTGGGTITAAPAGTPNFGACSGSCSATYAYNTVVALTSAAAPGSTFSGWSGACSGTGACTVTMDQARAATATFTAIIPTLTVSRTSVGTGAASGTITSADAGINCGATCSHDYAYGAVVTLTATPQAGANFSGWSGACSGTGTCTLTMDQARAATATFSLPQNLAVTIASSPPGYGLGAVTAIGINCPGTCSGTYTYGTMVMLTATANSLGQFGSWSGAPGCTTAATCTITMDQARAVTATFNGLAQTLTVSKTGAGTVTGISIDCGATCSASYPFATSVTLTATPAAGWSFSSWSGCASTIGAQCTVQMLGARAPSAVFTINSYPLSVSVTTEGPSGSGVVTSSPGGINCGGTCVASYAYGTSVTLTAAPGAGAVFLGWTGSGGSCTGLSCTVTIFQAVDVGAVFGRSTYTLTTAAFDGTVRATGINCGPGLATDCTQDYPRGTAVSLTFTPRFPTGCFGAELVGVTWNGCEVDPVDPLKCTASMTGDVGVDVSAEWFCPGDLP